MNTDDTLSVAPVQSIVMRARRLFCVIAGHKRKTNHDVVLVPVARTCSRCNKALPCNGTVHRVEWKHSHWSSWCLWTTHETHDEAEKALQSHKGSSLDFRVQCYAQRQR